MVPRTRSRMSFSRDPYTKLARKMGFVSRASFKLMHVQRRYRFIERGDVVVILGSAPGGMAQLASKYVGPEGLVLAVDVKPQKKIAENVINMLMDVVEPGAAERILSELNGRKSDKLISDLSPRLSGIRETDIPRQLELVHATIKILDVILKSGGGALIKVFESPEVKGVEMMLKERFDKVRRIVPTATRKHSSELFLLAQGKV